MALCVACIWHRGINRYGDISLGISLLETEAMNAPHPQTPETDAAECSTSHLYGELDFRWAVSADFARSLELRLAAAMARVGELEQRLWDADICQECGGKLGPDPYVRENMGIACHGDGDHPDDGCGFKQPL